VTASPLGLLVVHTDQGVVGSSMIFTYTPAALGPCAKLLRNLEAPVQGRSVAPVVIW